MTPAHSLFRDWSARLKQRLSVQAAVAGFMALIGLALIGGFIFDSWKSRKETVDRATENASNLVQSVAQHAESAVRSVDAILIGLVGLAVLIFADNIREVLRR